MLQQIKKLFSEKTPSHLPFKTDIHSHLIPGIDDGAKTVEDSIAMIRALHAAGYTKLITTPHCMPHRFDNDTETILKGLDLLRREVEQHGIAIKIDAAAEYFYDEHFARRFKEESLLTFDGNCVLFEFSYVHPPVNVEHVIFELQSNGYTPVLAHPERYRYFHRSFEQYEHLKSLGIRFQVNINSLTGYYGPQVRKTALQLQKHRRIDYLGSDAHSLKQIEILQQPQTMMLVQKTAERNPLRNGAL